LIWLRHTGKKLKELLSLSSVPVMESAALGAATLRHSNATQTDPRCNKTRLVSTGVLDIVFSSMTLQGAARGRLDQHRELPVLDLFFLLASGARFVLQLGG
jgi:hypothetical protein